MPYDEVTETKRRLIEAHQRDEDYREVARLLNVNVSTV